MIRLIVPKNGSSCPQDVSLCPSCRSTVVDPKQESSPVFPGDTFQNVHSSTCVYQPNLETAPMPNRTDESAVEYEVPTAINRCPQPGSCPPGTSWETLVGKQPAPPGGLRSLAGKRSPARSPGGGSAGTLPLDVTVVGELSCAYSGCELPPRTQQAYAQMWQLRSHPG